MICAREATLCGPTVCTSSFPFQHALSPVGSVLLKSFRTCVFDVFSPQGFGAIAKENRTIGDTSHVMSPVSSGYVIEAESTILKYFVG